MTVKELRDALSRFPEDLPVCLAAWDPTYVQAHEIGVVLYDTGETCYEPAGELAELYEPHAILGRKAYSSTTSENHKS